MKNYRTKFIKLSAKFFLIFLPFIIFFYLLFINFRSSAFFQKRDRINIVVSEGNAMLYSLGLDDKVNYFISFFPDLEVTVLGGYGNYRSGALEKLASLEKKPDLFKKTFSLTTSNFIDFYFYPDRPFEKINVAFGEDKVDFDLPRFNLILFGKSNAHLFDRIYLLLQFFGKTKGQFKIITRLPIVRQGNRTVFSSRKFFESFQGNFYQKTYRNEQRSVQILYTKSDKTAQAISQILEGEGIRVVDVSKWSTQNKVCEVMEDNKFSKTSQAIAHFFSCQLVNRKTEAYDIILKLGEKEKEWEVN